MAIIWFYSLNIKGGRAYLAEKKISRSLRSLQYLAYHEIILSVL